MFTANSIIFYNGEPIAHGCVESRSELLKVAWEQMGRAGYVPDAYGYQTHDVIQDFEDFLSYFDVHDGIEEPIIDLYDAHDEPVSIVCLVAPFYAPELCNRIWWGYDGDEMHDKCIQYCDANNIDINGE